jgi:hypothetical protein
MCQKDRASVAVAEMAAIVRRVHLPCLGHMLLLRHQSTAAGAPASDDAPGVRGTSDAAAGSNARRLSNATRASFAETDRGQQFVHSAPAAFTDSKAAAAAADINTEIVDATAYAAEAELEMMTMAHVTAQDTPAPARRLPTDPAVLAARQADFEVAAAASARHRHKRHRFWLAFQPYYQGAMRSYTASVTEPALYLFVPIGMCMIWWYGVLPVIYWLCGDAAPAGGQAVAKPRVPDNVATLEASMRA